MRSSASVPWPAPGMRLTSEAPSMRWCGALAVGAAGGLMRERAVGRSGPALRSWRGVQRARLGVAAEHDGDVAPRGCVLHHLNHLVVGGRLAAHRVGLGGVAGDQEGLAAATAKVLVALVAGPAGGLHPAVAAR